jgi:hypothetical protein
MVGRLKRAFPTLFADYESWSHDGKFHLLHARRGRGKSYNMTWLANEAVRLKKPVISNISFRHDAMARLARSRGVFPSTSAAYDWISQNVRFSFDINEIMCLYDGVCILDEMQQDFNVAHRAKGERMPDVFTEWMEQSRKHKLTLVYASQSFDWLDKHTKQLADMLWESRRVGRDGSPQGFYCYGTDPKGAAGRVDHKEVSRVVKTPFDLQVALTYNTHQALPRLSRDSHFANFAEINRHLKDVGVVPEDKDTRTFDAWARDTGNELHEHVIRRDVRPVRPFLRYV